MAVYRVEPGRFARLFLDTTERRAAAEKRALLLREIDHRAKNALAVVQSMIRLTKAEDIPSFIKTVEGRDGVADMLGARLSDTAPTSFRTREAATEDGDVTSAFIEFETAVGRGVGHLRLKNDKAWTLLTALQELKGHEERKGPSRVLGAVHGNDPDPRSWAEKRAEEEASLGRTVQPYVVVVGGGQGGIALGARLRQLGVPAIVLDKHERPDRRARKSLRG